MPQDYSMNNNHNVNNGGPADMSRSVALPPGTIFATSTHPPVSNATAGYQSSAGETPQTMSMYMKESFPQLISEGGYQPEQVFNMDETRLFWKRMPSRTFLFKDEVKRPGYKAHKDRVTLIMCGNAAGFLLKPGLIYKSKNPLALRNKNKNLLPVHWMHNPKALITKALLSDWFNQCFVPQVKLYLAEKGIPFKVLLLLDCADGHPTTLNYEGVRVKILPPNTMALIQPMDQGVICAFKALYTRSMMEDLIDAVNAKEDEEEEDFTMKAYWSGYTIATCLHNMHKALKEMKPETINASWKKLWPEVVHDHKGFTPNEVQHSAVDSAVKLARLLHSEGFRDMSEDDVRGLIDCHSEQLTDDDLIEMTKFASEEEEEVEQQQDNDAVDPGLTFERLQRMMSSAEKLQDGSRSRDEDMVRSAHFCNLIDGAMSVYKALFTKMKRHRQQLPFTVFFLPMKKPAVPVPSEEEPDDPPLPVLDTGTAPPDEEL